MLFAALTVAANAASNEQDKMVANTQTEVTNNQVAAAGETDIFREHALQSEEADRHIIRFYDIDRIVIQNDKHAIIRIYDDKWQLIEKTNGSVDKDVRAGNYYVTCTSRITSRYQH